MCPHPVLVSSIQSHHVIYKSSRDSQLPSDLEKFLSEATDTDQSGGINDNKVTIDTERRKVRNGKVH